MIIIIIIIITTLFNVDNIYGKDQYSVHVPAYVTLVHVERPPTVRKVGGSTPGRDIPKVVKRWYQ